MKPTPITAKALAMHIAAWLRKNEGHLLVVLPEHDYRKRPTSIDAPMRASLGNASGRVWTYMPSDIGRSCELLAHYKAAIMVCPGVPAGAIKMLKATNKPVIEVR